MKKTLITTSLRLIPKTLQNKALCKALNYLFLSAPLGNLKGQVVKLNVTDIKKSWFVSYGDAGFEATKLRKVSAEIKTKLNVAMSLNDKQVIINALKNDELQVTGEPNLAEAITNSLYSLDEKRLESISNHLFSFFNIKNKQPQKAPRLDIHNIKDSDLTDPLNVDFIRDEAIKLENTDLKKALSLMLLAQQARPHGKVINNKVKTYQAKLATTN